MNWFQIYLFPEGYGSYQLNLFFKDFLSRNSDSVTLLEPKRTEQDYSDWVSPDANAATQSTIKQYSSDIVTVNLPPSPSFDNAAITSHNTY